MTERLHDLNPIGAAGIDPPAVGVELHKVFNVRLDKKWTAIRIGPNLRSIYANHAFDKIFSVPFGDDFHCLVNCSYVFLEKNLFSLHARLGFEPFSNTGLSRSLKMTVSLAFGVHTFCNIPKRASADDLCEIKIGRPSVIVPCGIYFFRVNSNIFRDTKFAP